MSHHSPTKSTRLPKINGRGSSMNGYSTSSVKNVNNLRNRMVESRTSTQMKGNKMLSRHKNHLYNSVEGGNRDDQHDSEIINVVF